MKIRISRLTQVLALGGLVLLGSTLAVSPARAQDPGVSDKPVTLNLNNVPIKTALELLFRSAGVRNFTIAPDVQGFASIQAQDQPFSSALRNLLSSVNSTFSLDNGSYNITIKRPTPPPAAIIDKPTTVVGGATTTDSTAAKQYFPLRINKYDAFVIASLIGQLGIVDVPPNITRESGNGQGGQGGFGQQGGNRGGFGQQGGGFGQQGGGFGGQGLGITTVGGNSGGGGFGGGGRGGYGGGYGR